MGCSVVETRDFPDHHRFRPDEIIRICEEAAGRGAVPVTTEKDFVRLPEEARLMVQCVAVDLEWASPATPDHLLAPVLRHG
jgi:tetraacyldisaccharide 4'-kinase